MFNKTIEEVSKELNTNITDGLNEKEVKSRLEGAKKKNILFTNYGIAIAHMHGILKRSIAPFNCD